ncbi:hypothetical protein N9M39_01575 [Halieaceae bacterium]|nr:hypothetical protein [Halieaceae bacterium]
MNYLAVLLLATCTFLAGCATWNEDAGVDNHWRSDSAPEWSVGETSADEVMASFGPPSQIITVGEQVVYYYLRENISGSGYFFLLYNRKQTRTVYDRAIFFFDAAGYLTRYSYSREGLPLND